MASIFVSGTGTTVDISSTFSGNGADDQSRTADALRQTIRYLERKLWTLIPEEPSVLTSAHEGKEIGDRGAERERPKSTETKHEGKGPSVGKHKDEGEGRDE